MEDHSEVLGGNHLEVTYGTLGCGPLWRGIPRAI